MNQLLVLLQRIYVVLLPLIYCVDFKQNRCCVCLLAYLLLVTEPLSAVYCENVFTILVYRDMKLLLTGENVTGRAVESVAYY